MITLTIDNPKLEMIYYKDFGGDDEKFIDFLSQTCQVNNLSYQLDNEAIKAMIEEGEISGESSATHEEIWKALFEKYDKN
jgi:hypothetical protein